MRQLPLPVSRREVAEARARAFELYCDRLDLKSIAEHPEIERSLATVRNWSSQGLWKFRRSRQSA